MTPAPLSGSKGQRSRSPGRFTHRCVYASGSYSGGRGNVFTVGTILLCCGQAQSARRREALRRPQREERGGAYRGGRPPTACWNLVSRRSSVSLVRDYGVLSSVRMSVCPHFHIIAYASLPHLMCNHDIWHDDRRPLVKMGMFMCRRCST